jgi:hypothetical protein
MTTKHKNTVIMMAKDTYTFFEVRYQTFFVIQRAYHKYFESTNVDGG